MEPKKTPQADLSKKQFLFFNVGLIGSLLLVIFAFNFRTAEYHVQNPVSLIDPFDDVMEHVPFTELKAPPPPLVRPVIVEVKDEEILDDMRIDLGIADPIEPAEPVVIIDEPGEDEPDVVTCFLADGATPAGGLEAFYRYVSKTIKYPSHAKRMGIEGRIFVEFIVEKDGSLSNVVAKTRIGGGCDEEAVRVILSAPKWNPGKQRGKPVRQRMVLPIIFKTE